MERTRFSVVRGGHGRLGDAVLVGGADAVEAVDLRLVAGQSVARLADVSRHLDPLIDR